MTEIQCLPAQGVPVTWFSECISSCRASHAMVCVTCGSPWTHGSGSGSGSASPGQPAAACWVLEYCYNIVVIYLIVLWGLSLYPHNEIQHLEDTMLKTGGGTELGVVAMI